MTKFTATKQYRQCQNLFDHWYPDFWDAGQQYQNMVDLLVTPQSIVLEVGCGRKSLAHRQIRKARYSVGIDLNFSELVQNATVTQSLVANAESLPFASSRFNLIVSQWVVEHLETPEDVFKEIARVLHPEGRILIFTTNAHNYIPLLSQLLSDRVQNAFIRHLLKRPEHESFHTFYRANTRRKVLGIAQKCGLRLEKTLYVGNPFYFAFFPFLFRIALLFEKLTDYPRLRRFKLYMLMTLRKGE